MTAWHCKYFMPLNCTLKTVKMVNSMLSIFYRNKNKQTETNGKSLNPRSSQLWVVKGHVIKQVKCVNVHQPLRSQRRGWLFGTGRASISVTTCCLPNEWGVWRGCFARQSGWGGHWTDPGIHWDIFRRACTTPLLVKKSLSSEESVDSENTIHGERKGPP